MSRLATVDKQDWDHFFSIVHTEDGWIVPLLAAVEGVPAEEAFWRPGGRVSSIAEIVLHASGWLESTLNSVVGLPSRDHADWPEPPAQTDQGWVEIVGGLKQVVGDLSRALHNLALEDIYSAPQGEDSKRGTMLTDIFVHSAYHAGQIVKLRQSYEALGVQASYAS